MKKPLRLSLLSSGFVATVTGVIGCVPSAPEPEYNATQFTKVDERGIKLALDQGPWHCVHDKKTGLTWEVKRLNETPQFVLSTHSWFDGILGTANEGSCAEDNANLPFVRYVGCDTHDLIDHLNSTQLCAKNQWRLPRAEELSAISLNHTLPGMSRLSSALFPYIGKGLYWTSDARENANGETSYFAMHLHTNESQWLASSQVAYTLAVSD